MGRRRTAWWRVAVVAVGWVVLGAVGGAPGSGGFAASAAPLRSPSASPSSSATASSSTTASSSATASSSTTGSSYAFAEGAPSVRGATDTGDAERLDPGTTYLSSLPSEGKVYYRLVLDGTSTVYVAATAVPPTDAAVTATEGVRVSVQDADGRTCSAPDTASIGAGRSPRPLTVWGARKLPSSRSLCRDAGTYYVVVERVLRTESSPGDWDLELAPVLEPRLRKAGSTSAPEAWDSATPSPPGGEAVRRRGGGGFTSATALEQGAWRDDVRPGQTLFYKVPVDWGQQVYATADLSSASAGGEGGGFVPGGVNLALYNPVRGLVDDTSISYNGSQKSGALAALPPVGYDNRYAVSDRVGGMRFAGSYYLVVHLAARVGEEFGDGSFGLTLRVRVKGEATAGPGYAGRSEPSGIFQVGLLGRGSGTVGDAGSSDAGGDGGGGAGMKLVAVGGIGAGTLLLAVLGVWVVVGRRRAAGV
ncbi:MULTISPECIES: hypothetical protein [Streptomyces]|uniref:hypothetical protein n=1 Tax=Streptomyces TaxID=1883 RepID=UPI0001852969|nr:MULTISPECIES: hypothetical protein [Streptomyces]MYT07043.1 hypothetical protein [Streptomyces sp. SID5470]